PPSALRRGVYRTAAGYTSKREDATAVDRMRVAALVVLAVAVVTFVVGSLTDDVA
ncbi:MAG: hypothetical protein QOJ52_2534, partial [Acidimicrobiaceae bacterium]|nr:hypothetical protein [Acidimicrobiaceae bacterium]